MAADYSFWGRGGKERRVSTSYWNPTTGRWESREELGERPATAETVIASEALLCSHPVATAKIIGRPFGSVQSWPDLFCLFLAW